MRGFVWIQSSGEVVQAQHATIPFGTPAALFGESLFETVRVRQGKFFRLPAHLERLQRGIEALGWGTPIASATIKAGLQALLSAANQIAQDDLRVRITVLRIDDHGMLDCMIHALAYEPPSPAQYAAGVDAVVTSPRIATGSPVARHKTGQRLLYRLARAEAERVGAWEGILLNTDGVLADGSITSVHFVVDGCIHTPSHNAGALSGITQDVVCEIAEGEHISWECGVYPPQMLQQATEAFLTNAMIGVMPLVRVDGFAIGAGRPGPVTKRIAAAYVERTDRESYHIEGLLSS